MKKKNSAINPHHLDFFCRISARYYAQIVLLKKKLEKLKSY
ncbi:hypothetical protein Pint_19447 [Pistacia integerrima]|uniref:Uncharacterized protein n=1 Tax=Pistacia integerrima TaxID=434235 RepID=A0ACC0YXS7_9ROSI|nr:hypothetical protein Pint_19447 [Pistacia integerrima]